MTINKVVIDQFTINSYLLAFICSALFIGLYVFKVARIKIMPQGLDGVCTALFRVLAVLPWTLLCSNRAITVGYDTKNYFANYFAISRTASIDYQYLLDSPGYYVLNKILYPLDKNTPYPIYFAMAFIALYVVILALDRICEKPYYITYGFLFFILMFGPRMMDQSRQFIAVAFTMLAYTYLAYDDRKRFIIYMIVGGIFHTSCLLFIMFLFFYKKQINRRYLVIVLSATTLVLIVFVDRVLNIVYNHLPQAYAYIKMQGGENTGFGLGGLLDILPAIIFLIVYYYILWRYNISKNVSCLEACSYSVLVFRVAGYSSFFLMRMFYYGAAVSIVLHLISIHEMRRNKVLLIFELLGMIGYCYVVYFYLNTSLTVPYIVAH